MLTNQRNGIIFIIFIMIFLTKACSIGQDNQPIEKEVVFPQENPHPTSTTEEMIIETPTQEEVARSTKGQIAYISNGNVRYQNLETRVDTQFTFDADAEKDFLHVYRNLSFSDSENFLAFQYTDAQTSSTVYVYNLETSSELARFDHEQLLGWLWEEDVLVLAITLRSATME